MVGGVTSIATTEGPNYFINVYLGVTVNAALGLAKQVSSAVYQFTSNFQSAFNPQIVKAYAKDDRVYLFELINKTSQMSFYLLFLVAFPVILCADVLFDIWLVDVPKYAVEFCVLILISQLISALSSPLWMVVHATGNIKSYQITLSVINLLILPIAWIVLALDFSPVYIILAQVVINVLVFAYRLLYLYRYIGFDLVNYFKLVLLKSLILMMLIIPVPVLIRIFIGDLNGVVISFLLAIIITIAVFYHMGLDVDIKKQIKSYILKILHN
jgi:O-antigen/teichoic acid export membrane protein